jgi:hypothetical protein
MHLWATALIDYAGLSQHILSVIIFVSAGSIMAALNHTRWEVSVPGLFNNADHDTHHRLQKFNYAQYTQVGFAWSIGFISNIHFC